MYLNAKYDVFISYSRKDYVDEHGNPIKNSAVAELLDFLDRNELSYWVDRNGIYSGSEFVEIITDAITASKMMIFVSSAHSNESKWTTGEIFEAMEQKKLIVPFKIDDCPYNKKFRMMLRPLDFIEYFSNQEAAFKSLLKTITACRTEYQEMVATEARQRAEENARQLKSKMLEEIKEDSSDYRRHSSTLAEFAQQLIEKQKQIGNVEKECPVCSTRQPIESIFCKKCGWTFNPVFDENPQGDKDHLFIMRSLWNTVQRSASIQAELEAENLQKKQAKDEQERKEKEKQKRLGIYSIKSVVEVKFRMIYVKGGKYTMKHGKITNEVNLPSYYIGETPVTLALWEKIMGSVPVFPSNTQLPVYNVSWNDCQEFIKKLNDITGQPFRMPTEAEWEFAAKGGHDSKGYLYSGSNDINEVAWCDADYWEEHMLHDKTATARGGFLRRKMEETGSKGSSNPHIQGPFPVKGKKPNELGIYDMSGNVWEWCQEMYYNTDHEHYRVYKGGCWKSDEFSCRTSSHFGNSESVRCNIIGLRLAMSE